MQAAAAVSRVPAARGPTFAAGGRCARQPATSAEYAVPVTTFTALAPDGVDEGLDAHPATARRTAAAVVHTRQVSRGERATTIRRYRDRETFPRDRHRANNWTRTSAKECTVRGRSGSADGTMPSMTTVVGQLDHIDVVTVDQDGQVRLIMTQVEQRDDSDDQLLAIQAKVNNYLVFVLDGQIGRSYPSVDASRWRIRVDCQTQPTERIASFLDGLSAAVTEEGGALEIELLNP